MTYVNTESYFHNHSISNDRLVFWNCRRLLGLSESWSESTRKHTKVYEVGMYILIFSRQ